MARVIGLIEARLPLSGRSFLDIGCGKGDYIWAMAQKHRFGRAWGLDVSAENIRQAEANGRAGGDQEIRFLCQDFLAFETPLKFDLVFSESVLHYLPASLETILGRLCDLTTPDGWIVFSWCRNSPANWLRCAVRRLLALFQLGPLEETIIWLGLTFGRRGLSREKIASSMVYLFQTPRRGLGRAALERAAERQGLKLMAVDYIPSYSPLALDHNIFFLKRI